MRYNVEHQRNIAFDLMDLRSKGISLADIFETEDVIAIYGFDFLGKEVYNIIKNKVKKVFFIDRAYNGAMYDNAPVFSLESEEIIPFTSEFDEIKVINMVISDENKIENDVMARLKNASMESVYEVLVKARLLYDKGFMDELNSKTKQTIDRILKNEKPNFRNIILVGTTYTQLLSIMYVDNWEESMYIMERYIDVSIANSMKENELCCLYEKTPIQYYSLTYVIAAYARRWNIPVYGHDHMSLSRAFLTNRMNVVEDGAGNYDIKYAGQYPIVLDNGRNYYSLGFDELVNKVILTGQFEIPCELRDKAEVIDPQYMWKKVRDKEKLLSILGLTSEVLSDANSVNGSILFLTETNISAGAELRTQDEQVLLYKEILSNYPTDLVFIKPHPADKIDYNLCLPEYKIIRKSFPIQILMWLDVKFSRVVLMQESSCLNIFNDMCEVDVYNDDGKKIN
ncbi:MAG: hypothetical protein UH963_14510 [Agathobacter sp.]|nr:hypothetical protein [Agathobacter sp.]